MSAFIVSTEHIHAMVSEAKMDRDFSFYNSKTGKRIKIDTIEMCNQIGQELLSQNYRSVNARYKESDEAPEYRFRYSVGWSPVEIMKACQCYEYQACETDDYEETLAIRFSRALKLAQIKKLRGYDDAPWEITEPKSNGVPMMSLIGG